LSAFLVELSDLLMALDEFGVSSTLFVFVGGSHDV
jgi:hypothetical protein